MKRLAHAWLLAGLIFGGCVPVYIPNVRNAPLFGKRGEAQGSVWYGSSGVEAQGAVAVTDHFAVQANYSYGSQTDTAKDNKYNKHQLLEGGLGYFTNRKLFCYEVFLGYGQGNGSSKAYNSVFWNARWESASGKFTRLYLQPSFGMNKGFFHWAFTPRVSMVNFYGFSNSISANPAKVDLGPKLFLEPAATVRFNGFHNRFFANIQMGLCVPWRGEQAFQYQIMSFSAGLGVRLGGIAKAEK